MTDKKIVIEWTVYITETHRVEHTPTELVKLLDIEESEIQEMIDENRLQDLIEKDDLDVLGGECVEAEVNDREVESVELKD